MAVISYKIYKIVFPKEVRHKILRVLISTNSFEAINPIKPYKEESQKYWDRRKVVSEKLNLLSDFQVNSEKLDTLVNEDLLGTLTADMEEFGLEESTNDTIVEHAQKLVDLVNEIHELKEKHDEVVAGLDLIGPLKDVKENVLIGQTNLYHGALLKFDTDKLPAFESYMQEFPAFSHKLLTQSDADTYVYVLSSMSDRLIFENFIEAHPELQSVEFEPDFLEGHSVPAELAIHLESRAEELESELKNKKAHAKQIVKDYTAKSKFYAKFLKLELEAYESEKLIDTYIDTTTDENINEHDYLSIKGWFNPEKIRHLDNLLSEVSESVIIEEVDPRGRKDIRTGLKNNRIMKPFESITTLMGVPSQQEIDPSPFISLTFVLFFGFALGDAGYGILIFLISSYFYLFKKPGEALRQGLKLFIYCGLATLVFGILSGNFFGDLRTLDNSFANYMLDFAVYDMNESLIEVLVATLAIGFALQIFGLVLKMVTYMKNGEYYEAFAKSGTWILLLFTIILLITASILWSEGSIVANTTLIASVAALLFTFGQGGRDRFFLVRPLYGVFSFFDITSYLSNTLSYARLLALGLATSVIGTVINILAGIVGGTDSVGGFIAMALVLVVGHLFNLALNMLGTFINIIRLQLVEFFPRFFEAKGTPLEPLTAGISIKELSKDNLYKDLI